MLSQMVNFRLTFPQIFNEVTSTLISDIVNLDNNRFQVRAKVYHPTVKTYKMAMREQEGYGTFPPVTIAMWRGDLYLVDGWHRTLAARWIHEQYVPAVIIQVKKESEIGWLAAKANITNAKPLQPKERKNVFRAYMENKGYQNRAKVKSLRDMALDLRGLIPHTTIDRWIKKEYPHLKHLWEDKKKHEGIPPVKATKRDTTMDTLNDINAQVRRTGAQFKDIKHTNSEIRILHLIADLYHQCLMVHNEAVQKREKRNKNTNLEAYREELLELPMTPCEPEDF